jgi:ribosomal protein L37AE/L43A
LFPFAIADTGTTIGRLRYGGMIIADTQPRLQTQMTPKCVYCRSAMTRRLKDTLTPDHSWLFECKDCGWDIALPAADDA